MNPWLIVLCFLAIALMRVAQKVCSKKVSNAVAGRIFFHYGGYYNLMSALFSLITLALVGFHGFTLGTVLCALATALCLAIELFAGIEALKSSTLIVNQMFSVGALFIPCIVGIFFFDEPMSLWQWLGLVLFVVAMYFMVSKTGQKESEAAFHISARTVLLLVVMLLAGGGTMVAQKAFGKIVPDGNAAMYSFLMFALNALILYAGYGIVWLKERKKGPVAATPAPSERLPGVLLICGLILAFAVFVINMLVTNLGKSVDSAILFSVSSAISILITILVGAIYYKEKITWKNVVGIVLCVGALAIINFL